jgi:hypothetical protein
MPSALVRPLRWSLLVTVAAAAACSAIRFDPEPEPTPSAEPPPPPPAVSVAGSWAGAWVIEGQRIEGTLVLRQDGPDLEATFASRALGGDAAGEGNLERDGRVELDLKYNVACPGTAKLTGNLLQDGTRLGGSLTATDCTGKAAGTFSFARR